jgi:MGT family glycosyltransferase
MSHIGIISPPVPGHLNPFGALGRALQRKGHRVTVFNMCDVEASVRAEGLEFCALGAIDHPLGHLPESLRQLSQLKGIAALRFAVAAIRFTTRMFCRDAPDAVRAAEVDLLLVDQTEAAGSAVAEYLGLPFVTVCNALALNRESSIPPPFTAWRYRRGVLNEARNLLGYRIWDALVSPVTAELAGFRKAWGMRPYRNLEDSFSTLAQISQQPPGFDYPRQKLPDTFQYVGPFRYSSARQVPFPWERLDGRPIIYASLGTLQNRTVELFRCIAEACQGLPEQLVISTAGGLSAAEIATLPGSPLVVSYAPQPEILTKARLTITHAGLNTVLDSLSQGVPVVAIPLTFEQPAIAARLDWVGAGTAIPYKGISAGKLRSAVQTILGSDQALRGAKRMAESIRRAGGVERAGAIIETVLAKTEAGRSRAGAAGAAAGPSF